MHVRTYVCMCVCMYVRMMYVCMYACMHVCMYACMHVCMCVCTFCCQHGPVTGHQRCRCVNSSMTLAEITDGCAKKSADELQPRSKYPSERQGTLASDPQANMPCLQWRYYIISRACSSSVISVCERTRMMLGARARARERERERGRRETQTCR